MAKTIELRSKVTTVYDYKTVDISSYIPAFTPDEAQLEKDLMRVLKAHGTKESPITVEEGDMVTLSCDSETPRFNKNQLVVMVGKGLFSKDLEAQLPGKKLGVPFTVTADGVKVHGLVEKISRTILPELTDENVAGFGMEGIETVTDLKRYCVDRQLDRMLDDSEDMDFASAAVWQALSDNSEYVLDEGEKARALVRAEAKEAEIESQKPVFETEEERQKFLADYEEEYGEPYEDVDIGKLMREMFLTELKIGAMGCETARREGSLLTEDDYSDFIRRYMEAMPDATEEDVRRKYAVEDYAIEQYNSIICDRLDLYVRETFKKAMNPYS
jgi:FKBP-type peptidyl-prolyl cis-trans isomerase (trigger factor)